MYCQNCGVENDNKALFVRRVGQGWKMDSQPRSMWQMKKQ